MLRDNRQDEGYFQTLTSDLDEALTETQAALDDVVFTSPTQRVDVAQRLFQLAIMRAVAHYSYGASIDELRPFVLAILPYREQLTLVANNIPQPHQLYRVDFEQLGGAGDACGSANINRYIYTLWWLSLLVACDAPTEHISKTLDVIGEQGKDALFDAIAVKLGDSQRPMAKTLYYPDVYQCLFDAFSLDKSTQAQKLNQFISQWYAQLDDADWHGNHECDCEFEYTDYYIGYWCLEHALVANLLGITKVQLTPHPMLANDLIRNKPER